MLENTDELREVLRAGLAWLFDTVQPDAALDQHHGAYVPFGDYALRFIPESEGGRLPVVVLDVSHPDWDPIKGVFGRPLTDRDVAVLRLALGALDEEITDEWNGAGTDTVSIQLARPAHPSLRAAVRRYRAGCPDHAGSVFCSRENGCTWYSDGNAHLIAPAWPARAGR